MGSLRGRFVATIFVIRFFPQKLFGKLIGKLDGKFGWKICWKICWKIGWKIWVEMLGGKLVGKICWKCWLEIWLEIWLENLDGKMCWKNVFEIWLEVLGGNLAGFFWWNDGWKWDVKMRCEKWMWWMVKNRESEPPPKPCDYSYIFGSPIAPQLPSIYQTSNRSRSKS